jgi:hypothetical protein
MANVTGPLFSLKATGSVAKTLCYKKGVRCYVCRKYAKPSGEPSAAQIEVCEYTGERMNHWPLISPADQASWLLLALEQNIEPINAYLKFNWQRHLNGLESTDVYPPTEAPPIPDFIAITGSPPPIPDLTGDYFEEGTNDGHPAYKRTSPSIAWLWNNSDQWFISADVVENWDYYFEGPAGDPIGTYDGVYPNSGKIIVSVM